MLLQFGTNTPISVAKGESTELEIPLDQVRKTLKMNVKKCVSSSKREQKHFTVVVRDVDTQDGTYYHMLVMNANADLEGDVVLKYVPPQIEGHHYIYEIYKQKSVMDTTAAKFDRFGPISEDFSKSNGLKLVGRVTILTTKPNESVQRLEVKHTIKPNDFMKKGKLTDGEERYCRCVLHVAAKNREIKNPQAICRKSTKNYTDKCNSQYDFHAMPLSELLAYTRLNNISVREKDKANRAKVIRKIEKNLQDK